jgi:hypothetical protein
LRPNVGSVHTASTRGTPREHRLRVALPSNPAPQTRAGKASSYTYPLYGLAVTTTPLGGGSRHEVPVRQAKPSSGRLDACLRGLRSRTENGKPLHSAAPTARFVGATYIRMFAVAIYDLCNPHRLKAFLSGQREFGHILPVCLFRYTECMLRL